MQQSIRNACAKFKVDRLSRFLTGACQVLTTQKPKFLEPWKLQHQILFKNTFSNQIIICQISFEIFEVTQIYARKKSKYLNTIGIFPFFYFIFLLKWNKHEIFNKKRQQKDGKL